ncbi:hypothetical protein CCM_00600 [Cordyceps militaris CM01]|uniref:Uncharacterized protein n=1 Tax=Cordyceps militaris (strain CM01) TaxID=983644 RepID=G3J4X9_CORMM|nr:uncharacterized protein CCM_00600 [Cordyceps militaris CM01]EGX95946.1 hypothetical protein CCM_00600 [Cordyceps militaris CM01]
MSWLCYVEPRRFSSPPCTSPHLPCKILRPVAKNQDTGQLLTVGADVSDLNPPSPSSPHCATPSLPARVVWRHRWASVPMLSPALAGGARSPTAPSVTVTQRASERRRVHHPRASCMRRPLRRAGGPDIRVITPGMRAEYLTSELLRDEDTVLGRGRTPGRISVAPWAVAACGGPRRARDDWRKWGLWRRGGATHLVLQHGAGECGVVGPRTLGLWPFGYTWKLACSVGRRPM